MASQAPRPSVVSKRPQVHLQKHENTPCSSSIPSLPSMPTAQITLDRCISLLGAVGIGSYMYKNIRSLSPLEICGLSAGSLALSYSILSPSSRQDDDASTSPSTIDARRIERAIQTTDKEDWKGQFKNRDYASLSTKEKTVYLKREAQRIKDLQAHEELLCGKAYIKKEEAYVKYERRGGYGGADWKRYSEADNECQVMYNRYQKQQKRLVEIKKELASLEESA